jgi:hypothetical protein
MQTVPNIVRERLKARPPVGNHPDADVLTAFAERSLPELERAVVLEHVARCGDCRDVVALALPETEAMLPAPGPVRSPWLTWPALRWGLVAAGIVVVASFGLLQYRSRSEGAMVAKQSLPEVAAPESRAEPAERPEQIEREETAEDKGSAAARSGDSLSTGSARLVAPTPTLSSPSAQPGPTTGAHAAFVAGKTGVPVSGPIQSGPRMPAQWQQQSPARVQGIVPAPSALAKQQGGELDAKKIPPASEVVEVQSSAPQMEAETSQVATSQAQSDEAAFKVDKAKAAPAASAETTQVTVAAPPVSVEAPQAQMETVVLDARALTPRWTISAAGALQRSFDQGNTWQNVDVTATTMTARNFTSLEIVENSRARKTENQKKEKKKTKDAAAVPAASPAFVFRAVAATGMQVWAGGSSGILYHSVDAGNQWMRVVPVSDGMALTGDIVGVEFSDALHGKITTSTAELWSTADAGQTWQKQ